MGRLAGEGVGDGASPEERAFLGVMSLGSETIERLIRENTKSADQRAMFFLAVAISMLAYLISHNAPVGWFFAIGDWQSKDYASLISVLGLAISAAMMLKVLNPTQKQPSLASIC